MGIEYIVPVLITIIFIVGLYKGVDVFSTFAEGAKDGLMTSFRILPLLICIITVISVFKASGALEMFVFTLTPIGNLLHIPKEVIPLAIMRPISGSGALAMLSEIIKTYGTDTTIGRIAAVMTSSTETTLYTIAVYTEGAGIKKSGLALPTALLADIFAAVFAVIAVNALF